MEGTKRGWNYNRRGEGQTMFPPLVRRKKKTQRRHMGILVSLKNNTPTPQGIEAAQCLFLNWQRAGAVGGRGGGK